MDSLRVHNFQLFPGLWVLLLICLDIADNALLDPEMAHVIQSLQPVKSSRNLNESMITVTPAMLVAQLLLSFSKSMVSGAKERFACVFVIDVADAFFFACCAG